MLACMTLLMLCFFYRVCATQRMSLLHRRDAESAQLQVRGLTRPAAAAVGAGGAGGTLRCTVAPSRRAQWRPQPPKGAIESRRGCTCKVRAWGKNQVKLMPFLCRCGCGMWVWGVGCGV